MKPTTALTVCLTAFFAANLLAIAAQLGWLPWWPVVVAAGVFVVAGVMTQAKKGRKP